MPRIAAILIYPIEGCRGVRVKSCGLSARGLDGDRKWKVMTGDGAALSEDEVRTLGRVWVELKGMQLWVTAAGMDRLILSTGDGAWFSKLLARPVSCVQDDASSRPLLATTTASLAALNQQLSKSVTVEVFRPNLVIEGTDAFAEETWGSVTVGGVQCAVAANPHTLRPKFGVLLTPDLTGRASVQMRPGQGLDVALKSPRVEGARSDQGGSGS